MTEGPRDENLLHLRRGLCPWVAARHHAQPPVVRRPPIGVILLLNSSREEQGRLCWAGQGRGLLVLYMSRRRHVRSRRLSLVGPHGPSWTLERRVTSINLWRWCEATSRTYAQRFLQISPAWISATWLLRSRAYRTRSCQTTPSKS